MVSRSLSVLVALAPAIASANAGAAEDSGIQQAALETWTLEQLCDARDNPEALDELERREIFGVRELRAIRRDEVREGISVDTLRCLKGEPRTILPAFMTFEGNAVDAFVYPPGTGGSLIVFIRRRDDVSTVAAFSESAEGYTFRVPSAWTEFCWGASSNAESMASAEACGPDMTLTIQRRFGIDVLTDSP